MEDKNMTPLASEMYADLKQANKFKERLIYILLAVIGVLIIALVATNVYHIHQWSEFDTVVIDSGEYGNAIYSQGDNSGGIYHGSDSSAESQEKQGEVQGDKGQN